MAKEGPTRTRFGDGSLVVATNRLPFTFRKRHRGGLEHTHLPGGLGSVLHPVLRKRGGVWLGSPGRPVDPGELQASELGYRLAPVCMSANDRRHYESGLSNGALWPLFHLLPTRVSFGPRDWEVYRAVNERFAEAILGEAGDGSTIWVHDYHLMLVPEIVRERRPAQCCMFFLHVPFPPYDVFTLMPHHEDLLRGILASDLVGLQVEPYVHNLLDCAARCLGADVHAPTGRLTLDGGVTRVGAFPVGIDQADFEGKAFAAEPRPGAGRLIVSADQLDYTNGIPQRIAATERLLEQHPEYREQVTLLQIVVPNRARAAECRSLRSEIDEMVGRVNGRFGTSEWLPIQYVCRAIDRGELAGIYRDAEVALMTPLHEGMNLGAKEFVACQVAEPGVLVLSRTTGAAVGMTEALTVNPYDVQEQADALQQALEMPIAERTERMRALRAREAAHDVHAWADSLIRATVKPTG